MTIPSKTFTEFAKDVAWLGEAVRVHTVGDYEIVEYHPRIAVDSQLVNEIDREHFAYSVYIRGTRTGRSFHTLDAALVGAIAYEYEGPNHRADYYFLRMIGAA